MTANRAVWTRLCISDLRYLQHQKGDETERERYFSHQKKKWPMVLFVSAFLSRNRASSLSWLASNFSACIKPNNSSKTLYVAGISFSPGPVGGDNLQVVHQTSSPELSLQRLGRAHQENRCPTVSELPEHTQREKTS